MTVQQQQEAGDHVTNAREQPVVGDKGLTSSK
jgi:hypothetical protein